MSEHTKTIRFFVVNSESGGEHDSAIFYLSEPQTPTDFIVYNST